MFSINWIIAKLKLILGYSYCVWLVLDGKPKSLINEF